MGTGMPKLYTLWAWDNSSTATPNSCAMSGGIFPRSKDFNVCQGGIHFSEVGFAPCGTSMCIPSAKCACSSPP
eukprot:COSAG02_NODE_914_length_15990_cov_9.617897_15_plen_73_part_00